MSHTLLSIIAGALIAFTLAAVVRLLMRRTQAEILEVGTNIMPENAAPRGAWVSVGFLAALAGAASLFAWGPFSQPQPPRPRAAAPAPGPTAAAPAKTGVPSAGRGISAWFDWLRPHPRLPGARRPPRKRDGATPAPTDGKPPAAADAAEVTPPVAPSPPVATPNSNPGAVLPDPVFIRRPSPQDIARFYPEGAAKGRVGVAVIACTVNAAGFLRNCTVVVENPAGQGFGEAALRVAYRFRVAPESRTGQPTNGRTVRTPVTFTPG